MIVLTVIRHNEQPTDGPSASFDELGGTIGRADQNQLVLPDPGRTISRVHARILFRNGAYSIVDSGSNPISINGRALGAGVELALKAGDEVQVGAYVLSVAEGKGVANDDPFADLFGEGLASAPTASTRSPSPRSAPVAPQRKTPSGPGPSGIPEDWDPFAPEPGEGMSEFGRSSPDEGLGDMVRASPAEDSLDDLFGLSAAPKQGDPLAAAVPPTGGPANTASHSDPLAALNRPVAAPPATAGDLGSELNTPMPLARAPRPPKAAAPAPDEAVFSWDEDDSRSGRENTAPGVRRAAAPANTPAPTPPRREPVPAPSPAKPPVSANSDDASLMAALLDGLGMPDLAMEPLTPETMRLIGKLLREATGGTVELLSARAALKRELRADVTMIVARENNPLKFSPTAEVALQHLLAQPMPGFMAPAPAMRDAFDDLRAHQLGVMAGMRAALEGVLLRFDPTQLEAKLVKRSSIADLLPSSRKARLWESFQELFSQLQTEAQDDFDELFGSAFLNAYESHIERLRKVPGPR